VYIPKSTHAAADQLYNNDMNSLYACLQAVTVSGL